AIKPDELYSTFTLGYDKWETEDYNGMDEILTKREFRLQITQLQNSLEQVSKILGSGYAIETTRRKGPDDKDWRYDNDVFAICLTDTVYRGSAQFSAISSSIRIPFNNFYDIGFQTGTIVISGTAFNNGTYTIVSVSIILTDTLIQVAEAIVNEIAPNTVILDPNYGVETDNIDNAANMVDPPTVNNYR